MKRSPNGGALSRLPRRRPSIAILMIAASGFALAAVAGLAVAKSFTLGIAKNVSVKGKKQSIVGDGKGLTVYDLSGESAHHALCTSANGCLRFWFPVTVASSKSRVTAAPGVKGKLGLWHRSGFFQVTLAGHPLYTFKLDNKTKGKTTGEGVVSFGGTWHVLKASAATKGTNSPTTSTSTTGTGTGTTTTPCLYPPCY